jgi:uroporphyrin-3 C-methyltransferase
MVVALVALVFALWQWSDSRREASQLQGDLARRVGEIDATGRDARLVADQVRNTLRDVESRMGMLEAKIMESQGQRLALESLYQELARNRDEWVLAEVEGILTTAAQQLQLAGNVRAALIALEAADKRLARADRPSLIPLRKVINADIDRLKALPAVDVPGLTLKLDNLIAAVDSLPLAAESRPEEPVVPPPQPANGFWSHLTGEFWRDLKGLLRVRVADTPEVPLLAPEQAWFLRENLKLKLLSARLALLSRDDATFRSDLRTAVKWLNQHFDGKAKSVMTASATLKQLGESELALRLPDLADSLEAVRSPRFGRK